MTIRCRTCTEKCDSNQLDTELIDTLVAISVAVHLRTFDSFAKSEILTFEEIKLNIDTHIAQIKDVEIKLTRTEYAILKLLMQNQTQVVSKSHLLDHISEDTPDCTESSLKTHISNLRKKLRAVNGKEYIEAVWGIGFKMKEE